MDFSTPLSKVKYVGAVRAAALAEYELHSAGDLANFVPYAYEDTTEILSISQLYEKWRSLPLWETPMQRFTVRAVFDKLTTFRTRRGLYIIKARFFSSESNEEIGAVWFNQTFVTRNLHSGSEYLLFGKVLQDGRRLVIQSPRFEELAENKALKNLGKVTPLYHRMKKITSAYIRQFLSSYGEVFEAMPEYIPAEILKANDLLSLGESYAHVHFPKKIEDPEIGLRRLEVQEILEIKKNIDATSLQSLGAGTSLSNESRTVIARYIGDCIAKLPFTLTKSQENAVQNIVEQFALGSRVDTFVYGDVGSGKTIVAMLLAFALANIGYSTVIMSPTSILAQQHVQTAEQLMKLFGSDASVVPVSAGRKYSKAEGAALYIGTHALLFSEQLKNDKSIGLVVIDEQHRFGVAQRQQLTELSSRPHILTLSATPIPRTLALSFLGFSEAIFITEKPSNRKTTITKVVPNDKVIVTYEWLRKRVEVAGEQIFMVFPRVVAEDDVDKQSVIAMKESLDGQFFSGIPTGIIYGGMAEKEKSKIMDAFRAGEIKVLYSTTVIEVGVDVPNATVIAIHGADLFGMAQLHQLRGRVGRSEKQGYCFLFSDTEAETAQERLEYFATHFDGIELAEYDLKKRGSGQLTGVTQAGGSELKIASLTNLSLIQTAISIYDELIKRKIGIFDYIQVKSGRAE